jgi:hypothetical protein
LILKWFQARFQPSERVSDLLRRCQATLHFSPLSDSQVTLSQCLTPHFYLDESTPEADIALLDRLVINFDILAILPRIRGFPAIIG